MVGLMATSKRVYTRGDLPSLLLPVSRPCAWSLLTHTSTGDPHTSRWFWFSLPWSYYSFPLGLRVRVVLLCPPRLESLFPPVLWKSCNQILLAFKVRFPGDSQSFCLVPRLRSLTWGSRPSQQQEHFFGITVLTVLQSVGHSPGGYGIWFYRDCAPPTVLLWLLLCLRMWGVFFGRFQRPPVDGCSTASCDFGVLTGGDERTSFFIPVFLENKNTQLLGV